MTAPNLTRQEWLSMREKGIGSSDAAAACGESKVSPAELVLQKRGIMQPADISDIEAVECGIYIEPFVVAMTVRRLHLRLLDPVLDRAMIERDIEASGETEVVGWIDARQAFLRSVMRPWQHAAIDGIAIDEGLGLVDIEAKNVGGYHSKDWDPENGHAPAKFEVQLAHQLSVAPAFNAGMLSALVGGNSLRTLTRPRFRLEAIIDSVIFLESQVWGCVLTETMPAFDGSESHLRALRALHPQDSGERITLTEEALDWHVQLSLMQPMHAGTGQRIKELKGKIEAAMNGATYGVLPDGTGMYTNRHQTRTVKPSQSTFPVLRFSKEIR